MAGFALIVLGLALTAASFMWLIETTPEVTK